MWDQFNMRPSNNKRINGESKEYRLLELVYLIQTPRTALVNTPVEIRDSAFFFLFAILF